MAVWAGEARADPQVSSGLTVGGGSVSLGERQAAAFHLGTRAELIGFRNRERDMGVGPFVAASTEALFRTGTFQAGAEWLVPAWGDVPFVFAAGVFERSDSIHGWAPGVSGAVFWGPHSYNFDGPYAMAGGIFVEGRHGLGSVRDDGVIAGVAIDLSVFAYPFLLLYGALAH
jgi:hypothetical protein